MTFRPLEGLRILDLSVLIPGAACTRYFADYGADVVKIEQPPVGDWLRGVPPLLDGISLLHLALDRGKRSIKLGLDTPEGQAVLHELAKEADAVVEVSRPGAMQKLGADFETLCQVNPSIVYLSLTAFGQRSDYSHIPAHGSNLAAVTSVGAAGPGPGESLVQAATPFGRYRLPLEDAALHAAFGLLAALRERDRSGVGQHLDASLAQTLLIGDQVALMENLNRGQMFWPEWDQPAAKNAYYRSADGRVLGVAPVEKKFWAKFCALIGRPDLTDAEASSEGSVDLGGGSLDLYREVQSALQRRPRHEWLTLFSDARIPAAPLNTPQEALADINVIDDLIVETAHPLTGEPVKQFAPAVRDHDSGFSAGPPPSLGEHTEAVLRDFKVASATIDLARHAGAF